VEIESALTVFSLVLGSKRFKEKQCNLQVVTTEPSRGTVKEYLAPLSGSAPWNSMTIVEGCGCGFTEPPVQVISMTVCGGPIAQVWASRATKAGVLSMAWIEHCVCTLMVFEEMVEMDSLLSIGVSDNQYCDIPSSQVYVVEPSRGTVTEYSAPAAPWNTMTPVSRATSGAAWASEKMAARPRKFENCMLEKVWGVYRKTMEEVFKCW
jgi:hypothetical protein